MSPKPKILHLCGQNEGDDPELSRMADRFDIEVVQNPIRAFLKLCREDFAGVYVSAQHADHLRGVARLLQNELILQSMPDGVALIDAHNTILWGNAKLQEWTGQQDIVGQHFYTLLGNPEILGPDFGPFSTALATGSPSTTTLRCPANRFFRIHAAPVIEGSGPPENLIVTIHDVTDEELQHQKLAAIHKAGADLANLTTDELFQMTVEERIELLKSNILHYTEHLLNFDVVEIRLLDKKTNRLMPLLAVGMEPEAVERKLYRVTEGNGVTGYVAATGKSYLCDDTTQDPLYLEGCRGAKSSLTVPLVLHDETIGTFNVESPRPRAFTEQDRQFLEIFSRNVAAALNTLELLSVEKVNAAVESVEAIHSAVALPVDDILIDAVNVMESYIGHSPDVVERLQRILRNARDIKQVIQKVGQQMAPAEARPSSLVEAPPTIRGLNVLVVDADDAVRVAAHNLLERFGCIVETAHDGGECLKMVRNFQCGDCYQVIIADIRLPDMGGYDLYMALKQEHEQIPLVLMTGYGYDPGHSIVKARQAGLKHVLYKPFRLDQLLSTVEMVAQEFHATARAS
ncbi:MAG: response regulator [Planctomycetaceae bacterium]|nr:response regulator [Planctomycetaceae bacterium]